MKKKNSELRNFVEQHIEMQPETVSRGTGAAAAGIVRNGFAQIHPVNPAAQKANPNFGFELPAKEQKIPTIVKKIETAPLVSDEGIEFLIEQAFHWRVRARTDCVRSSVVNGIVKLWGSVPTWDERHEVELAVILLPGVHAVENNLKVEL